MKHLYCAGKIGNATKDKLSDCIGLFGKGCEFHQWAPLQSPSFSMQPKMCHRSVFVISVTTRTQNGDLQVNSYEGPTVFHYKTGNWECKIGLWCGDWNGFSTWLQTLDNFPVSKETPTMKIYRGETAQVHWCQRTTQDLHHFSCLSDHTTYMQTSTVMNLLCVSVCVCIYVCI